MNTDSTYDRSDLQTDPSSDWVEEREPDEVLRILTAIFTTVRRNWIVAAVVFVLTVGAAVAVSLVMTPLWRAEIVVIPVSESDPAALSLFASGLNLFGGGFLGGGDARSDEALAVLRSRELFDAYAQEKNLLPVLYDDLWDGERSRWTVPPDRVPTLRQAYDLFNGSIREIEEDLYSGTVTLSITWKDREQAVIWAREIIAHANRRLRERAAADSMRNIEYLNEEMRNASGLGAQNALSTALANAYEQQLQNYMFARGQEEYAFRVIDPPTIPDEWERVWPQRRVLALVGVLLGGIFAIGAAFLANFLSRGPRRPETA